jgi:poly(hydroxyalkanoate) granule-associated protein
MTAQTKNKQKSRTETLQTELTKRGRDVWLAGLGALATVEEEGNKLYKRLVERGKEFEKERREELKTASENVRKQRDEALAQIEEASEETQSLLIDTVNTALERFGVPTRNEVDRLSKKVGKLSRQVDRLSESLSKRTATGNDKK